MLQQQIGLQQSKLSVVLQFGCRESPFVVIIALFFERRERKKFQKERTKFQKERKKERR